MPNSIYSTCSVLKFWAPVSNHVRGTTSIFFATNNSKPTWTNGFHKHCNNQPFTSSCMPCIDNVLYGVRRIFRLQISHWWVSSQHIRAWWNISNRAWSLNWNRFCVSKVNPASLGCEAEALCLVWRQVLRLRKPCLGKTAENGTSHVARFCTECVKDLPKLRKINTKCHSVSATNNVAYSVHLMNSSASSYYLLFMSRLHWSRDVRNSGLMWIGIRAKTITNSSSATLPLQHLRPGAQPKSETRWGQP